MRRRRFIVVTVAGSWLSGCSLIDSQDDQTGTDPGQTDESPTNTQTDTKTPTVSDLAVENWRNTSVGGDIIITTAETPAVTDDRPGFMESFELDADGHEEFVELEILLRPATIQISLDGGLQNDYQWDGGASFNRGVVAVIKDDEIDFTSKVA